MATPIQTQGLADLELQMKISEIMQYDEWCQKVTESGTVTKNGEKSSYNKEGCQ